MKQLSPEARLLIEVLRSIIPPIPRTMREFAEQEVRLPPGGPYGGLPFRIDRQPVAGLWFDACDATDAHGRPLHRRRTATGPAQDGKSLACFIIPILFHLFEIIEPVILGAPTMEMARDKWVMDLKPVIEATRYRQFLPATGTGSRGGGFETIQFTNGATLKMMSSFGGDGKKSGFTSRVIAITEVDKMDTAGETSREADPVSQMETRSNAFDERAIVYMECTISIEEGRINQEITQRGTNSRIVLPCPHCDQRISLDREHLIGWEDAASIIEARDHARYCCPSCGVAWSEDERFAANRAAVLIHDGQEIDSDGVITGDARATDTLGFRWNSANSLLKSAGRVGSQEWTASHAEDSDNAETELRQFWWALPCENPDQLMVDLSVNGIMARTVPEWPRGIVPNATETLTVGIDPGKYLLHWVALACGVGMGPHIVDYGVMPTEASVLGAEEAVKIALFQLHDRCEAGWDTEDGAEVFIPDQVWIDARYLTKEAVYPFIQQVNQDRYIPTMGYGAGQHSSQSYSAPRTRNRAVREIGDHYHFVKMGREHGRISIAHVDANGGKTLVHERLAIPLRDERGVLLDPRPDNATTLFAVDKRNEHLDFAKHITAERQTMKFVEGRGMSRVWDQIRSKNHWLDATSLATVAQGRKPHAATAAPQTDFFKKQAAASRKRVR